MITVSGYRFGETLHEGSRSLVMRGVDEKDGSPVVLKMLIAITPGSRDVGRYRYSYELTKDLDFPGVCQSRALLYQDQRPVLVMDDFGGISLRRWMQEHTITLKDTLQLVSKVADALGGLHSKQILHKDINPSNILVLPDLSEVQIIDFDFASRIKREYIEGWNPQELQGTLAYMAPEQTGRMNRTIDHRADLYALGVMFYEMLTGFVPFVSKDAAGLIHSHIAIVPQSPHAIDREIPVSVSEIVMKLLAKSPEQRYQSAVGVKVDVEHCLKQLSTPDEEFVVGRGDLSPHLQLSQKLYGREDEVEALQSVFEHVCEGNASWMMIGGYSGVGKTALVRELYRPLTLAKGHFASGKFSPLQRTPHSALLQALREHMLHLLTESEKNMTVWRDRILVAVGDLGQLIIDVVPELGLLLGPQPKPNVLGSTETQNRFKRVFQHFLLSLMTPEEPLVLFLDDFQWADATSLQFLEEMFLHTDVHHLMVIGTYRDNEVDEAHPVTSTLKSLRDNKDVDLIELKLEPLSQVNVSEMLSDTLHQSQEDVSRLAELLFERTYGNPFFVERYLMSLHEQKNLYLDLAERRWKWNTSAIQKLGIADNVAVLMGQEISQLPSRSQRVLQHAACLGPRFSLDILAALLSQSRADIADALWPAVLGEFITPLDDTYRFASLEENETQPLERQGAAHYRFVHDRVQEAAYAQLPVESRPGLHQRIGDLLWQVRKNSPESISVFRVVEQLNLGEVEKMSKQERMSLALLNEEAGQTSMAALGQFSARDYFQKALDLLDESYWEDEHSFAFELLRQLTEAVMMCSDFDQVKSLEDELFRHVKTRVQHNELFRIQSRRLAFQSDHEGCVRESLKIMETFGIPRPKTDEEWGAAIGAEFADLAQQLEGIELDELLDAPEMTDPDAILEFDALSDVAYVATTHPQMFPLVTARIVNLLIRYGRRPRAPQCYMTYGFLQAAMKNYPVAEEFGQLALKLFDRYPAPGVRPIVEHLYGGLTCFWSRPLKEAIHYTSQAFKHGLEEGVFINASWAMMLLTMMNLAQGSELEPLLESNQRSLKLARHTLKFNDAIHTSIFDRHILLMLMGRNAEKATLEQEEMDEESALEQLEHYPMAVSCLRTYRMQAHYILKNYDKALLELEGLRELIAISVSLIGVAEFGFYTALTLSSFHGKVDEETWTAYEKEIHEILDNLTDLAAHNPSNFAYKEHFVRAEIAVIQGDTEEALTQYNLAYRSARENDFTHIEGLSLERTATLYLNSDREREARGFLQDAHYAYMRWGALAKTAALEQDYPFLRRVSQDGESFSVSGTGAGQTGANFLDTQSILKATQALSRELRLENLLKRMMDVAIENAGAQSGMLLLKRDNTLRVEARIEVVGEEPSVLQSLPLKDVPLALSVVRFVERTRQPVVLGDATQSEQFSNDSYIRNEKVHSILCTPILNQNRLVGILYLQNAATTDVFTSERVALLDVLSAQAAISIENAHLYDNLEEEVAARTNDLQEALRELQQKQSQLVHSGKMASLGTLVSGVAHELNNPVSYTLSGAVNLKKRLHRLKEFLWDIADTNDDTGLLQALKERFDKTSGSLHAILDGSEQIGKIIADLRTFSRLDEAELQQADVVDGLRASLSLIETSYQKHLVIKTELSELPLLQCRPAQLNQVFMNLALNACQAIVEKYPESTAEPEGCLRVQASVRDDGWVSIRFEDNGVGIPPEAHPRLFEPFFTTKDIGEGTGLGLSIAYGIIQEHHGRIEVESTPGEGSCFTISLPA